MTHIDLSNHHYSNLKTNHGTNIAGGKTLEIEFKDGSYSSHILIVFKHSETGRRFPSVRSVP